MRKPMETSAWSRCIATLYNRYRAEWKRVSIDLLPPRGVLNECVESRLDDPSHFFGGPSETNNPILMAAYRKQRSPGELVFLKQLLHLDGQCRRSIRRRGIRHRKVQFFRVTPKGRRMAVKNPPRPRTPVINHPA